MEFGGDYGRFWWGPYRAVGFVCEEGRNEFLLEFGGVCVICDIREMDMAENHALLRYQVRGSDGSMVLEVEIDSDRGFGPASSCRAAVGAWT